MGQPRMALVHKAQAARPRGPIRSGRTGCSWHSHRLEARAFAPRRCDFGPCDPEKCLLCDDVRATLGDRAKHRFPRPRQRPTQ